MHDICGNLEKNKRSKFLVLSFFVTARHKFCANRKIERPKMLAFWKEAFFPAYISFFFAMHDICGNLEKKIRGASLRVVILRYGTP